MSTNKKINELQLFTGDTTGTWLTTNGIGMYVQLGLGVASGFSGTAGVD